MKTKKNIRFVEYLADRQDLLPELAQLHFDEWSHFRPGQTVQDRIERLKLCCQKSVIPSAVVATEGQDLIGSALLVAEDLPTRKDLTPWLAGVYVKPEFRRTGVATQLIQRIEQEATELGIPKLFLFTDKESHFYGKRGWQTVETCDYQGLDVTIMQKPLTEE